jgi:rubrerythrin
MQGHPTYETIMNFVVGGFSLGLVVEVVGMLRQWLTERKEEQHEKKAKFLRHHHVLKEKVLDFWLSSSVNATYRDEDYPNVEKPVYLATFRNIQGQDNWYKWLMQHIYDDEGYPSIKQLIEELKAHEKEHNRFVGSLVRTIDDGIRLTLKDFSRLEEWKPEKREDYFFLRNVRLAVLDDKPLRIFNQTELSLENGDKIATSDNATLTRLKNAIERIRLAHEKDLQNIHNGIKKDRQILESIQEGVKEILYELALEKPLKGKCDYERSLDK